MSDLFGSLSLAVRALEAQRTGLDVVGQNIANVNTPGYSRREVQFAAVPPTELRSAGEGVTVAAIRANRDMLLEQRFQQEVPAERREAAIVDALSVIETALGTSGESIDGALTAFFDAFGLLADNATSATARQGVLIRARSLADAFHDIDARLRASQRDMDRRMSAAVDQVNVLIRRIADINASYARVGGPDSTAGQQLRDDELVAVNSLAELIDIGVLQRQDGGFDITFANGQPLVVGPYAYPIVLDVDSNGLLNLRSQDVTVTSAVTGGQIGGLLHVRDVLIPDYLDRLDRMAYALAERVNALHQTGFDLDGQPGDAFFVPLADVAGAAAGLAVSPALLANPRMVAAAGQPSAGDNQVARAIAALRDARVLGGGIATFAESWAELVYRVGQDANVARQEQDSRGEVVRQLGALRDAVSGVSLDEEAATMIKFQRAYEANARYFRAVDTAIDTLLQMIGS